jgi:DNA-binding NtrC family response regulator
VVVPPLRERRDEIEPLAGLFIAQASAALGQPAPELSRGALEALQHHGWPGNIRELRNVIERAVLVCSEGVIAPQHLSFSSSSSSKPAPARPDTRTAAPALPQSPPFDDAGDSPDGEYARILWALATCGGNQSQAARELGIGRRTLVRRLDSYGVPRPRKPRQS